ncbi:hypothetical protein [Oxalobacter paraformigenes]|uniref:Autotransporter outer membrane beta-barrel domain-containing protein n=1 Tax=Oxalobacter paraformigenes TaxID=556268 RepID=C3X2P5_9BURK|nr:hypothetical protein [Oxalobacter paraformigenes]EEO27481.1 hypothetical protein OFAG_00634 [Oxalobacter paraformigenes]
MAYDSGGDITGIGDANLVVTGDLTVRSTYGGKYALSGANLFFEGGSVRVDGNTDLSAKAINSGTAGYTGFLAGIYANQGNSSRPFTEMTFGKDASSTFHLHDIHLTSTQQQAEAYGIRTHTASTTGFAPAHQSHIIINSKAIIENIKAVSPDSDFAYAAGVEASESAHVEFKSDLTVRNIAAVNGNDVSGLTSGTSGSDAEAYSLIALRGGQIDVNAARNAAYTVQI